MAESPPNPGRRRLLDWFLAGSVMGVLAAVAYPILRFLAPPRIPEAAVDRVEAGQTNDPDLLEKGFKIVRFGADPVILVRVGEGEYRAFSATCTHLDCIVEFRKAERAIWCNCHNGVYDLQGRNVGGPPPRPLAPYQVHLVSNGPGRPETVVVARA